MKRIFLYGMATLVVVLFAACNNSHNHEDHDHAAEQHNHEAEGEEHEGDEHGHEGEKEGEHESHEGHGDEIEFSAAQAKAAGLALETVNPSTFAEVIRVSGRILPAQGAEATVTATIGGIVSFTSNALTPGAKVGAGQSLFAVNAKAMANGNPAATAQAELDAAKKAVERARRLAADRLISNSELEEAERRFATAQTTAQSTGLNVRTASSPIAGYIKEVLVQRGQYVEAGQALATVTQSRRVQLRADVPERHYGALSSIVSANFRPAYAAERTFSLNELGGRLVSRGQAATTGDYFVPVTFEFDNAAGIVPGALAEVFLIGAPRQGVLSVPTAALAESQGLHFVYVQTHDGIYARREVTLGATDGLRTEIKSGLAKGDKVVTKGVTQVRLAANKSVVPEGHSH